VILAEYFEIWIIELNLNGYCLNCSESQSSGKNMLLCEVKTIFEGKLVLLYKIYTVSKKCVLRVSIPTGFVVVAYPVLY
jgi:hypothetical protein